MPPNALLPPAVVNVGVQIRAAARQATLDIFGRLGLHVERVEAARKTSAERRRLLVEARAGLARRARPRAVGGIVFSRDRPIQLHALLDSYRRRVSNPARLDILYRADDARMRRAYDEVIVDLADLSLFSFHQERDFPTDLRRLLGELDARRVFFLVDDIIFVRDVDMVEVAAVDPTREILSLRLGANISWSGATRSALDRPTSFAREGDWCRWRWSDGTVDWACAHSIDGNVFDAAEVEAITAAVDFRAPNTYELALGRFADIFAERGGCSFATSRLVNIPANRVQEEVDNDHLGIDPGELLRRWESGECIDVDAYRDDDIRSVHQELPLRFRRR
jgi:hypothetical protein